MKLSNGLLQAARTCLFLVACITTQAVSAATLLTEDFEDGNWDAFSSDDLAADHSARVVNSRYRSGARALRFELLKTDPPVHSGSRAEVVADDEPARQERWYAFSIFLPAEGDEAYANDRAPEIVAQWHNQPDLHLGESWTSPPLALLTENGRWKVNRYWDEDPVTSNDKMWAENKHQEIDLGSYQRGVWTDWVFHVRWGWLTSHSPLLEIYRNGVLVHQGTTANMTNDQLGVYFKMGLYKWVWSQNKPSDTVRRVIYHDEVRFADAGGSLQAVSPPSSTPPPPPPTSGCPSVSQGQWRSLPFPKPRASLFTSSAVLTPSNLAASATFGLAPAAASSWNGLAAAVLFSDAVSEPGHPANSVLVRDDGEYRADQVLIYEAGRRYHVRMVVNPANQTYSVDVTPEGGSTIALAKDYVFRDGHAGSTTLSHWVLGATRSSLVACGMQNNGGDVACRSTPTGGWGNVSLGAEQTGSFTAELTTTPDQLGAGTGVGLSPTVSTSWAGMSALVLFSDPVSEPGVPPNSILVRDADDYRADRTLIYEPGRRYRLRFDVDVPRRRYSVRVIPEGGEEVLLANDYRFRQGHEAVTVLKYWTFAAGRSAVHACGWSVGPAKPQCLSATQAQWQSLGFVEQVGSFEARAEVVPAQLGSSGAIGFSAAPTQAWTGLATTVLFSDPTSEPTVPTNSILVRDGVDYRADSVLIYQANQRYAVRMQVDLGRQRYSTFVTPPGGSEVRLAYDYQLRSPTVKLGYWTLGTGIAPISACLTPPMPVTTPPTPSRVQYGWLPPAQTVGGGSSTFTVAPGYIHQTAWDQGGAAPIEGVYTVPWNGWTPMVWRWADTMRGNAIRRVSPGPGTTYPVYRFELTPQDHASPGTAGDHPRAEFFSVDPAEDRRTREPPRSNIIVQGDEYWATMAFFLPSDFPTNHKWATLLQRKFQNGVSNPSPWFTLNVHKGVLDVTLPRSDGNYKFIANLAEVRGRWTQITLHEIASAYADGLFEVYMNGRLVAQKYGPTLDSGNINYNFHLGYYRANEAATGEPVGPGLGVMYETPLLILRGNNPGGIAAVPVLP